MDDIHITCIFCGTSLDNGEVVTVTSGLQKIRDSSHSLKDGLAAKIEGVSELKVHILCRKNYTRPGTVKKKQNTSPVPEPMETEESNKPCLRSAAEPFDIKQHCLFCGKDASTKVATKKEYKYRKVVHECMSKEFVTSIRTQATKRNDDLGKVVDDRVKNVIDLVAAEGIYHHQCHLDFYCSVDENKSGPKGRPEDTNKQEAFSQLCEFMDNNDECQYSLTELWDRMNTFLHGKEGYTKKWLKKKLQSHYKDKITITEVLGHNAIISLRDNTYKVLNAKWYADRQSNMEDERQRIVRTAAAIIREDIRSQLYDSSVYPSLKTLEQESEKNLPESLKCFIDTVIQSKNTDSTITQRKRLVIAEALIAATRPRSYISPILLGLSIFMYRHFGSRQLIEVLNSLGLSASYKEVQRYESSVLLMAPQQIETASFVQFVFDNADFNVNTLDGHNTFHSLGGIKCITPAKSANAEIIVPRIMHPPTADEIGSFGKVPIKTYVKPAKAGLPKIKIKDLPEQEPLSINKAVVLDTIWISGKWVDVTPRPSWNGYMEVVMQGTEQYEMSKVEAIPFINLDPGNPSTLYTALKFANEECQKIGQATCVVTFDQPLYMKAADIVQASEDLDNVVVRLGGFHLLMSYMGAVGHIMSGSGLEELWSTVYAPVSVTHMISGHAYSRALRAHFLTQEALGTILLQTANELGDATKETVCQNYRNLLEHKRNVEDVCTEETEEQTAKLLEYLSDHAKSSGRTGQLWLQYFEQVNLMRLFLRAERMGDWELHLHSIRKMLSHFHAAGHLAYARSAHLYVQQMEELSEKMNAEELEQLTEKGFFTVRRSDKLWGGIWSDMTIEQVLMRSLKTSGGLTHGRGLSESTLARWVLTTPVCMHISNALENFCGVATTNSEQHVELRDSRQQRDHQDLDTFIEWLRSHSPFQDKPPEQLVSLGSGLIADGTVNCDKAIEIGSMAVQKMTGENFAEVKLKRKDKVNPLASMKNTIRVRTEDVVINSKQLFNRIICTMDSSSDLENFMEYELAPQPPSLFDDISMRRPAKSVLANVLDDLITDEVNIPEECEFVLDGGHLLHRVVWPRPATYEEICTIYVNHVENNYKTNATVVFDGYEGPPTTKSEEQRRRSAKACSADIAFESNMHATTSQANFLGNAKNKSRLISAVSSKLSSAQIAVLQATADADELIVSTALNLASKGHTVVVVGSDTDLLVMLVARAKSSDNIYLLHPCKGTGTKVHDIKKLQNALGDLKDAILFLHAISGCDTTSAPFGKGKKTAFKVLKTNRELAAEMQIFNNPQATHAEVAEAGERFFVCLYGSEKSKTVNQLRYLTYNKVIARQSLQMSFDLATLPQQVLPQGNIHSEVIFKFRPGLEMTFSQQTGVGNLRMVI